MGWESAAGVRLAQASAPTPTATGPVFFPSRAENSGAPARLLRTAGRARVLLGSSAVVRARRVRGDRRGQGATCLACLTVVAAVLLSAAPAQARDPRGTAVGHPEAAVVAGPCRERLLAELRQGEISPGPGCEVERQIAQRRQLRRVRGGSGFGLLERATTRLGGVSILVSEGRGCAMWPLRPPGHASLGLYEIKQAGCWVRRYNGALTISGVLADGSRVPAIAVLQVREGQAQLDLTRLAVSLDRRGFTGLDDFMRLELGADAWAGGVDLVAVRAELADFHAASVLRGRGVAALLPVRHPDHPVADRVRALALKTTLLRQDADFKAVERGELAPHRFLERHAWSPYRRVVAAMGGE